MTIRKRWQPWLFTVLLSAGALVASAVAAGDPAGDFLGTYTGPHNGDLDVPSADVGLDQANSQLVFSATFNGAIGTSPDAIYVFGLGMRYRHAGPHRMQ